MKWYNKSWIMWACLIFFTPIGLILLYINRERHPKWKIIAGCSIAWFIIALSSPSHKVPQETPAPKQEIAQQEQQHTQSPTASKADEIKTAVAGVIKPENIETINYVPDNKFLLVKFKGSENLTNNMTVKGMYMNMRDIMKALKSVTDANIDFNVVYPLTDKYGNSKDEIVIKATFTHETIQKINFENVQIENIPKIADEWWSPPAVKLTD